MKRSILAAVASGAVLGGLVGMSLEPTSNANSMSSLVTESRTLLAATAATHCEIPCGIFDDHAQVEAMRLDAKTIQKANAQILELMNEAMFAADPVVTAQHANTMMRWVMVKEEHAKKIQHTVAWYFMTQRVKKPTEGGAEAMEKYHKQLAAFDGVATAAMKGAQSTEPSSAEELFAAIDVVAPWYPAPEHTHGG